MLDKSSRRLAIEIRGRDRVSAENHLVKFGASVSGAAAVVAMCLSVKRQIIVGTYSEVAFCIETNCYR